MLKKEKIEIKSRLIHKRKGYTFKNISSFNIEVYKSNIEDSS